MELNRITNVFDQYLHAIMYQYLHTIMYFDTITILIHWRIWKECNARIFEDEASNADRVLELIREDIVIWRSAGCVGDVY